MGIKVGPNGRWKCAQYKKTPVFTIQDKMYCPTCGRPVKEWYNKGAYRRMHTDVWGNYNGC